jgi:hypothetical protein
MKPLEIQHGRFRLLYGDNAIRIDMDGGNGLLMVLTEEERKRLSRALWYRSNT